MSANPSIARNRSILTAYGADSGKMVVAFGTHTTVAASDTVATGLKRVTHAIAQLQDAPVIGATFVLADIGDQAGTPAAGGILIKSYKPTATNDATPTAGTTFSKRVSWVAIGEV